MSSIRARSQYYYIRAFLFVLFHALVIPAMLSGPSNSAPGKYTKAITARGRLRQEDCMLQASLGYIVRDYFNENSRFANAVSSIPFWLTQQDCKHTCTGGKYLIKKLTVVPEILIIIFDYWYICKHCWVKFCRLSIMESTVLRSESMPVDLDTAQKWSCGQSSAPQIRYLWSTCAIHIIHMLKFTKTSFSCR